MMKGIWSVCAVVCLLGGSRVFANDYFLGQSYNSDLSKPLSIACLLGDARVYDLGDTDSTLVLGFESSFEKEVEKRNLSVSGSGDFYDSVLHIEGSYNELKESVDTDFRSTVNFYYKYQGPSKRFAVNTDVTLPLNPLAREAYSTSDYSFRTICGDSFVSDITYGGSLYVSISLNFATRYDKQKYEAKSSGEYGDLYSAASSIELLKEKFGDSLKVSVFAHQVGGNATDLGSLLASGTGETFGECDVGTGRCSSILEFLAAYVSASGTLAASWVEKPAPLSAKVQPYDMAIPNYSIIDIKVPHEVMASRELLYAEYLKQLDMITTLEGYLKRYADADIQARWNTIRLSAEAGIVKSKSNLAQLKKGLSICYSDLDSCVDAKNESIALLENIILPSPPVVVYPSGQVVAGSSAMELSCSAPSNSVVVGIGAGVNRKRAAVTGIRLAYRTISPNGELGARNEIQCGTNPEDYIEAPNGEVLVGFGARVDGNANINGLRIVSAPWNPSTKSITKTYHTYSTGNVELAIDLRHFVSNDVLLSDERSVITGVAMRENNNDLKGLALQVGWIE